MVCRRPYQRLIDGGVQRAHPVYVTAADVIRVSERNQQIVDAIAALACAPAPTGFAVTEFFNDGSARTGTDQRITPG